MVSVAYNSEVNNHPQSVRRRTILDGKIGLGIGAVVGATEGYLRKSWLTKGEPSDKFVSEVSKTLISNLSPEDKAELKKVNAFFVALTDSKNDVYSLRTNIENSKELSNAIEKQGSETTKDALDRIFSNKKPEELKHQLRHLQDRTKLDKAVNIYHARDIINDNLDIKTKTLKKSESTSQEVFDFINKSAKKIKLKTAFSHTLIGGALACMAGLLIGASRHSNNS